MSGLPLSSAMALMRERVLPISASHASGQLPSPRINCEARLSSVSRNIEVFSRSCRVSDILDSHMRARASLRQRTCGLLLRGKPRHRIPNYVHLYPSEELDRSVRAAWPGLEVAGLGGRVGCGLLERDATNGAMTLRRLCDYDPAVWRSRGPGRRLPAGLRCSFRTPGLLLQRFPLRGTRSRRWR